MAHFHIKKKKGRPYLYVREIARVNKKPKVISQIYIGSPEKVAALAAGKTQAVEGKLAVEEFGSLWLSAQMDNDVGIAAIIDEIVPKHKKEKGPSVGEYFLYCVWNRMVKAVSKNKLPGWYKETAIQHIRPVEVNELSSQKYWEKWDRVNEKKLELITRKFFQHIWEIESPDSDCLLFDTTNYYTFMASDTESDLAIRGKSKEGRHHLRQVGLGLLMARHSRLPLYYCVYPGNVHDSRQFKNVMDDMFGIICGFHKTKERLTVIIDKGMNSEENFSWIDEHSRIHFITNYSTYFAEELTVIPLSKFEPADTKKNRRLAQEGIPEERVLVYRTEGEYWGKNRSVLITYTPATARKQNYTFKSKIELLRNELLDMRMKVKDESPHWRNAKTIKERYHRLCERLHIASDYFVLEFSRANKILTMSFKKDVYCVDKKCQSFGKNIIITDNIDWSTSEILEANLDRWQVENNFRISKDDELVGARPFRHWTDTKIRCHLFTCVVALTNLRRMELKLEAAGVRRSAEDVMTDMRNFHSVLSLSDGRSKPVRKLETPSKTQAEVLTALGYQVNDWGVLQKMKA